MYPRKKNPILDKLISFISTDIWRIEARKQPKLKSFLLRQIRTFLLAIKGFQEDNLQLRASALTFFSILSIVPVVAMAFGVAKGFGFQKILEEQLMAQFSGQQEVMIQVTTFANTLLENTKGGLVAGIGVAVLFWTVINVLGNIELSFNYIWGVKTPRSLGRRFSDYLSIMFICPILVIASSSATVFIASQVQNITSQIQILGALSPYIFTALKILPYTLYWVLFTFVYIFMPNTKVKFSSALLAGIIAGTIYQVVQFIYIDFQIGVSQYNAIYGSFAALPLFLVWVQISWTIVLFGAEISFAHQNVDTYEFEPDCLGVSSYFKKIISLRIMNLVSKSFAKEEPPLTDDEISDRLETPIRLVRQIIFDLVHSGLLTEIPGKDNKESSYQPAHDICEITIKYAIDALDRRGNQNIPVADSEELKRLVNSLEGFNSLVKSSPDNLLLKDI